MLKTLFLSPPSFDGFDGGAGARYQAKREITSYWFPTWLAQPAAMVPGSKLIDAAPHHQTTEDVMKIAKDYELIIMHTSTPSLANDVADVCGKYWPVLLAAFGLDYLYHQQHFLPKQGGTP